MIGRLKFNIDNIVESIISKIPDTIWDNPKAKFLDPSIGGGQFVKVIEKKLRDKGYSDKNIRSRVYGMESNKMRVNFAINKHKLIGNYVVGDFLKWETSMKFDCIIGNPPYQTETDGNSRPIWDKFVIKSFDILNEDGYLALIHPAGWRNVDGRFTDVRDLLLSKQMEYLEIHNESDGISTFGAETRYDWYVVKNSNRAKKTQIVFEDGTTKKINLTELPFIPNSTYDKIASLIADPGEELVELIHNSSYHHTRNHVSSKKTKKFKHPVVYTVTSEGTPTFKWSSRNDLGHFGIPKLIWSNGRISSVGSLLDDDGKYGLTQFAYAITDTPKNLKWMQKAFNSKEFRDLMYACSVGFLSINHRIISTFRKDFWKEFV